MTVTVWRSGRVLVMVGSILAGPLAHADTAPGEPDKTECEPSPEPAPLPTSVRVLATAKLMGYLRLPDEQDGRSDAEDCPATDASASGEAREFLRNPGFQKAADTVLLGMGDNFAPELFSRVFRPVPTGARDGLYGKDQFTWDWAHRRWVFVDAIKEGDPVHTAARKGKGRIPMDNVACFLAAARYDAIVPGKHDFYFGPERLRYLARFLATRRGSAPRVQMLATNLVIRTDYSSPTKMLSDAERHIDYASSDKRLEPSGFSDGAHVLPWVRQFSFKTDELPYSSPCLYSTMPGDPSRRQRATCDHPLRMAWRREKVAEKPAPDHYLDLTLNEADSLLPGQSYAVCLTRPPVPEPGRKTPDTREYCLRITVDHPFFLYPNPHPTLVHEAQPYSDPDAYFWKCVSQTEGGKETDDKRERDCPAGTTGVAVFGVVDPDLKEHIGQLNYAWLNDTDTDKYKTEIAVMDPADALRQVKQLFDREHPKFDGVKILLAQMSPPRAQQLAAKLRGEYQVVISEAQAEHISGNQDIVRDGPPPRAPTCAKLAPSFVLVPPPFYDPLEGRPVFWPRQLKVSRVADQGNASRWSYEVKGDRLPAPHHPIKAVELPWLRRAIIEARNQAVPDAKEVKLDATPSEFKTVFREYVLRAMKEATHADAALLQERDFFFDARLSPQEVEEASVPLAIDRILWKGDIVVKRTLPGKALTDALKRSKAFRESDGALLSLDIEKGRGLFTLGVTFDAAHEQYIINGEPLQDGRLYTVATSDYAGLGDTGYPELVAEAVGKPLLPRDFDYVCPLHLLVERARTGHGDDEQCGQVLAAADYFDHLEGAPVDLRIDSYLRHLVDWASSAFSPFSRSGPDDAWKGMSAMEQRSQLSHGLFLSLSKAAISGYLVRNGITEAQRQERFQGITVPQVQTAKSSQLDLANQMSVGFSGTKVDLFLTHDLAFTQSSTGRRDAPRVLNFANNRLVIEGGLFFHVKERKFPRWGPQVTVRTETQVARPLETFTLSTSSASELGFDRPRTWSFQLPRAGVRYQGRENQLQLGFELSHAQSVDSFAFHEPLTNDLIATCRLDPHAELTVQCKTLVANLSQGDSPRITPSTRVLSTYSRVWRPGFYAVAKATIPPASKLAFVSEHDFEVIFAKPQEDNALMTHKRYLTTNGLRFKLYQNLAITPKLELFYFQNQRGLTPQNQYSLWQRKWSIELSYGFDWYRGNPWIVATQKKPDK